MAHAACTPRPCARPRFDSARRAAYTSKASKRAATEQATLLSPQGPSVALAGPLAVSLLYVLPLPLSWTYETRQDMDGAPHAGRPDVDNLAKLTMDVISRLGWWGDDSQVTSLTARKRYGWTPGVHVRIDRDETGSP